MKLFLCHNLTDPRFAFFAATEEYLRAQGLEYAHALADADIAFYCANMGFNYYQPALSHFWAEEERWSFDRDMRNILWLSERVDKLIIYIRDDGSSLIDNYFEYWRQKGLLSRIIVTKDFKFTDEFLESEVVKTFTQDNGGYYFYLTQILEAFPKALSFADSEITQRVINPANIEQYRKIYPFTWRFHTYGWLGQSYERVVEKHKDIDVFYVKRYRKTLDGYYRREILRRVSIIRGLAKWTAPLSDADYVDTLCRAKVVITPWGLGECVWDDWKASINGVQVIRPDTKYVKDYYGIYSQRDNPCLNYCEPDLSNFETVIEDVISKQARLQPLLDDAASTLRSTFDLKRHANDFLKLLVA